MRAILRPILFAALPLAVIAAPANAAEVQIRAQGPVAEITATHTVKVAPDIATVSAGVTSRAQSAVEAMRQNAAAMAGVVAKIKALGVDPKDIQTQGIGLSPQYRYNGGNTQPTFLGYNASNRVSVTLRKVAKVGETLDALVAAGATNISGPSFSVDDDTAIRAEARKAAFAEARAQALEYAKLAGYSNVRLLEVDENVSRQGPVPVMMEARLAAAAPAAKTPVEPGQVGIGVTVTAKFEMAN